MVGNHCSKQWKKSLKSKSTLENELKAILEVLFIFFTKKFSKDWLRPNMSVFAFRSYIFYKYVFILMKYVILFWNIFLYFTETYVNVSTSKYVYKNVFSIHIWFYSVQFILLFFHIYFLDLSKFISPLIFGHTRHSL